MKRKPGRPRSPAPRLAVRAIRFSEAELEKYGRLAAADRRSLSEWVRVTLERVTAGM